MEKVDFFNLFPRSGGGDARSRCGEERRLGGVDDGSGGDPVAAMLDPVCGEEQRSGGLEDGSGGVEYGSSGVEDGSGTLTCFGGRCGERLEGGAGQQAAGAFSWC